VAIVDTSDPFALSAQVILQCDRYGSDYDPLVRTAVFGVSMGMTSEEPVINLTRWARYFGRYSEKGGGCEDEFDFSDDEEEEEEEEEEDEEELRARDLASLRRFMWGMTLEGSTVHGFLRARGWGDNRIPIQLDDPEASTLSGRNSYCSRVALLHLGFRGIDVRPWVEQMAAPSFGDRERLSAFAAGIEIGKREVDEARFHVVLVLPRRARAAAFWLAQQAEESLGKNPARLIKVSVPDSVEQLVKRSGCGGNEQQQLQQQQLDNVLAKCTIVRIRLHDEGGGGDSKEDKEEQEADALLAALGCAAGADIATSLANTAPVIRVSLALGAASGDDADASASLARRAAATPYGLVPRLLHWWTHAVLAIGVTFGPYDTVGQYSVELYKRYVQVYLLECLRLRGLGDFSVDDVNTNPAITEAKQAWIAAAEANHGGFIECAAWTAAMDTPFMVKHTRIGLHGEDNGQSGQLAFGPAPLELRYPSFHGQLPAELSQRQLQQQQDASESPIDKILRAWIAGAAARGKTYAEIIYFGDLATKINTEHLTRSPWPQPRKLAAALDALAERLFADSGLVYNVTEGPRDNHSRLEMSTAARNDGIVILITDATARMLFPRMPAGSSEYLAMQAVATYQSFIDHGRETAFITVPADRRPEGEKIIRPADLNAIMTVPVRRDAATAVPSPV
jgi:hypothetical protein